MADDAAGAVRRTPNSEDAGDGDSWNSAIDWLLNSRFVDSDVLTHFWHICDGFVDCVWCYEELKGTNHEIPKPKEHFGLPLDAVQLVGPDQRRPVVLLRADDCDCGPPYADCPHGPEPVDALDLAVWLHAEQQWLLGCALARTIRERDSLARRCARRFEAEQQLQARIDAALALMDYWDAHGGSIPQGHRLRAALQGDQPTEPRHELVLKSGLSGCTGACSCGTWHGGGRHEPPSRVAYRWDAEHLTSLPLEQPTGEADRG